MKTIRDLVDPELVGGLELFPTFDLTRETLPAMRQAMAKALVSSMLSGETRVVPGPRAAPDVPIRIHYPQRRDIRTGAYLHFHGGGFIVGSSAGSAAANESLAKDLDITVVSVDYRLAPEAPYPAQLEDGYAALRWLFSNAESLNVDPTRIVIGGDSAGGGLAAAVALLARDRGEYALAGQHLVYPMLDDRTCTRRDPHPFTGELVWSLGRNHFAWSALLNAAPGAPDISAHAAPARETNLAGLPRTFLEVGALDLFLEETVDYGMRLTRAGVLVELHVYPGAYHGFRRFTTGEIAAAAEATSRAALARALRARTSL